MIQKNGKEVEGFTGGHCIVSLYERERGEARCVNESEVQ